MVNYEQPPEISVITPVLNGRRFIEDAIRSVLRQGYPRFEHVVVDGGSTDGTLEILNQYPHLRWVSESDRGLADAMNKGFRMSVGDVVVYLMADDYFEPDAFRAVLPHLRGGAQFVVGRVNLWFEDGSVVVNDPKVDFGEMLRWWEPNAYCHNPVGYFYLRQVQDVVGPFNRDIAQDLEFLLEASQRYPFTKIDKVLGTFRILRGTKTFETSSREPEIMGDICDRYLAHFDSRYVRRYQQDRRKAELQLTREARTARKARLSVRQVAKAFVRRTRNALYGMVRRGR
jgi:glycosyltransferase involved in cell wall biosynthesis